jgi:aquaporin NIP
MTSSLQRALVAEAIGTALVFAGAGAVMVDAKTQALGHVGVAITFGLVIMAMIYAVGHISGAHFNAAVTFAFALSRHFPWRRAAGYLARPVRRRDRRRRDPARLARQHRPRRRDPALRLARPIVPLGTRDELLPHVRDHGRGHRHAVGEAAAIAIGGTIGVDAMFGGPISGASMNPARSLAPALASGNLHALWLYLLAPIVGAALGALTYQFIRGEPTEPGEIAPLDAPHEETRAKELV